MGSTDPLTGARYPQSQDAPDIATFIQQAVNDLSAVSIPYCTSTSDRNSRFSAWVAAGHTMRDGLKCYVQGVGEQTYIGGSWVNFTSDTGWVPVTLNGPLTVGPAGCVYRLRGGVCTVGLDINYSGTYASAFSMVNTVLPAPTHDLFVSVTPYGGGAADLHLTTSGTLLNVNAATFSGLQGSFTYLAG